jgi:hypothetical protein
MASLRLRLRSAAAARWRYHGGMCDAPPIEVGA